MKKILAILSVALIFAVGCIGASADNGLQNMTTDEYRVEIFVGADNTLEISEKISVDFLREKHGIYRYIPYILEFNDGESSKRIRAAITDVDVMGDPFTEEIEGTQNLIIIGDEDVTIRGQKTYDIRYKMQIFDDETEVSDFFYFNLAPLFWETDINNFSAKIQFQNPLPEGAIPQFYMGDFGSTDTSGFESELSDNRKVLSVVATRPLHYGETITASIVLPEGYFSGERNDNWAVLPAFIGAALLAALAFLLWFFLGRDKQVIPVVNFNPPEGLSSAEIGHIVDGFTDQKDLISLIIYWAGKGYLEIHQDGKDFTFVKRCELPRSAKSFESVMFHGLFSSGSTVSSKSLKHKFYKTMELATADINRFFTKIPENRIYTRSSTVARVISWLLCGLPFALSALACLYASGASEDTMGITSMAIFIASLVFGGLNIGLWDKRHASTKGSFAAGVIALAIITILAALGAAFGIALYSGLILPVFFGAGATLVAMFFAIFTNKRTERNTRLLGEIVGFKQFIEYAELDKLKAMVEQDPQYFYNIIPFAYVLGLSDKWAKKFESIAIAPPDWYYGYDYPFSSWMFWHSFNSSMEHCRANMVSVPSNSSGGSGGFGGFAGGGFGGGGGGSW